MEWDRLHCAATLEHLDQATEFVEECADRFGLAAQQRFGALLALEEAFVNICSYAYADSGGEVELACGADGDVFVLEVADRGAPFDVLSLPEPDTTRDLMGREIGGLGVHFIRKLSDRVSYRRQNGQNILRMVFKRRQGSASEPS